MRRTFFIGAGVGLLAFVQALVVFRLPLRIHVLETWAIVWSGLFGLMAGSLFLNTAQAVADLTFAGIGLPLFYGVAAVSLRAAYRRWKTVGVVLAFVVVAAVHVSLYLVVIRSVVA